MVTLLWTLVWLALAVTVSLRNVDPAPTQLPRAAVLTVSSHYFVHVLKWAPGPGTPADVHYQVFYSSDRGNGWLPVPGCERVQNPLACELTQTFSDKSQVYLIKVTTLLEDQVLGSVEKRFDPIRDTYLDLPLLTLTPCGRDLCVDLQPPVEELRNTYNTLSYNLKIWSNGVEHTQDVKFLTSQVLKNLNPGREYCVSICFFDRLVQRKSNYSRPVCGVAPGNHPAAPDALIASVLCPLLLVAMAMVAWLAAAGYICLSRRPLPAVLASVCHRDGALVLPGSSLTSLLAVEVAAPPAGKEQAEAEESGEEQLAGSSGEGYMLWHGCEQLAPSAPRPLTSASVFLSRPSSPTPPQPPAGGLPPAAQAPAGCVSGAEAEEEEEEEEGEGSQDVDLLTLTFGMQPGDNMASSSSEDVTVETSAPTWTLCPGEEQEQEEQESRYMCHP